MKKYYRDYINIFLQEKSNEIADEHLREIFGIFKETFVFIAKYRKIAAIDFASEMLIWLPPYESIIFEEYSTELICLCIGKNSVRNEAIFNAIMSVVELFEDDSFYRANFSTLDDYKMDKLIKESRRFITNCIYEINKGLQKKPEEIIKIVATTNKKCSSETKAIFSTKKHAQVDHTVVKIKKVSWWDSQVPNTQDSANSFQQFSVSFRNA